MFAVDIWRGITYTFSYFLLLSLSLLPVSLLPVWQLCNCFQLGLRAPVYNQVLYWWLWTPFLWWYWDIPEWVTGGLVAHVLATRSCSFLLFWIHVHLSPHLSCSFFSGRNSLLHSSSSNKLEPGFTHPRHLYPRYCIGVSLCISACLQSLPSSQF